MRRHDPRDGLRHRQRPHLPARPSRGHGTCPHRATPRLVSPGQGGPVTQEIVPDLAVDITRDTCPMTFVRTRLALDRLSPGQVLQVTLRGDEPRRNVPLTATAQGHAVLAQSTDAAGTMTLLLRKG